MSVSFSFFCQKLGKQKFCPKLCENEPNIDGWCAGMEIILQDDFHDADCPLFEVFIWPKIGVFIKSEISSCTRPRNKTKITPTPPILCCNDLQTKLFFSFIMQFLNSFIISWKCWYYSINSFFERVFPDENDKCHANTASGNTSSANQIYLKQMPLLVKRRNSVVNFSSKFQEGGGLHG